MCLNHFSLFTPFLPQSLCLQDRLKEEAGPEAEQVDRNRQRRPVIRGSEGKHMEQSPHAIGTGLLYVMYYFFSYAPIAYRTEVTGMILIGDL